MSGSGPYGLLVVRALCLRLPYVPVRGRRIYLSRTIANKWSIKVHLARCTSVVQLVLCTVGRVNDCDDHSPGRAGGHSWCVPALVAIVISYCCSNSYRTKKGRKKNGANYCNVEGLCSKDVIGKSAGAMMMAIILTKSLYISCFTIFTMRPASWQPRPA